METKTDFNFNGFIEKLKQSFLGFEFEAGGNPNDSEDPPHVLICSDSGICCVYDPAYNPPCQKEGCIVLLVFNDQQKNLSISGLLVVPQTVFGNLNFMEPLKQILIARINPRKESAHIKSLLDKIQRTELYSKHDDPFSVSVVLKQDKSVLERKELEAYIN